MGMQNASEFAFNPDPWIEPVYEPSLRFLEAFDEFDSRLRSLQRYFYFASQFVERHLVKTQISLRRFDDPKYLAETEKALLEGAIGTPYEDLVSYDAAAAEGYFSDMAAADEEYFTEYLTGSIISHLFSLVEGLLSGVADDVAARLGQTVELPSKPMPYINKYVAYLQRDCGLSLTIDRATWKAIDAIRAIRNRYVHRLNQDLPQEIQLQLQKLIESAEQPEFEVNNSFVHTAFSTIGSVATKLDLAYWSFVDSQEQQAGAQ